MYAQNVEWKEITFTNGKNQARRRNTVWLTKISKTAPSPSRLNVSADLVEKLGWKEGTRVNLYRAGSLFKMSEASTELITFKMIGRTLAYNNWSLCAELHPDVYGTEFEAWIDKKELYFRPKE